EATLEPIDFIRGHRFPDTVYRAASNFDTHGFIIHPQFLIMPPDHDKLSVEVPLGCMLAQRNRFRNVT
ncbi:MAG: hypothetical protein MJH10_18385, partial [Epibacterium sp.]|nr:hypothetical protein [Epibacterium sp.]